MNVRKSYEYKNDFLYFVLRPDNSRGEGDYIYCSGVDLYSFLPITKGRHRPMSNPAMRGLQLVNLGVRSMVLSKGGTSRALLGNRCEGIVPIKNGWYKELLMIENVPESFPDEMIEYCVVELLRKFDRAIMLEAELPDKLLSPEGLQLFLEQMCTEYDLNL